MASISFYKFLAINKWLQIITILAKGKSQSSKDPKYPFLSLFLKNP